MGARYILGAAVGVGLVGLVACGFSEVGGRDVAIDLAANGDGGPSSSTPGGDDGGTSVPVVGCDSGLVDPGLVILPADGGACPSGTTERVVHTDPRAAAGACSCGTCTPTAEPTCAGANFTWTWGGDTTCNQGPSNYDITADNACITIFGSSTTIASYNRWSRAPKAGTCTAAGVADPTKVATTPIRECVPNANADLCAAAAAGERTCVPADADGGACAGKFSVPVVVGDGATVACEKCACAHTATACNVEYHGNTTCTSKQYERLADNTCVTTGSPTIRALKVYPMGVTCAATPAAPQASLTSSRALCCTP